MLSPRLLFALLVPSVMLFPLAVAGIDADEQQEITDGLTHAADLTNYHVSVTCDSVHAEAHASSSWWSENAAGVDSDTEADSDSGHWYANARVDMPGTAYASSGPLDKFC